jgi:hypothetical protein
VYRPRIKEYGPLVNLVYDNFRMDSINTITHKKEPTIVDTNCLCTYDIKWDICGMPADTSCVILINGAIFKNYPTTKLDKILQAYQLGNGQLFNVIDKSGNRQGYHYSKNENSQSIYYKDDIPDK